MMEAILGLHAGVTLALAGLIWFVQVVHYPLFAQVGPDAFADYERLHQRLTTLVVAPLMLVEASTAAILVAIEPSPLSVSAFTLVVAIWVSTAMVQVPLHRRLESGLDQRLVRRLVWTNWFRTGAWTARAPMAILLLAA